MTREKEELSNLINESDVTQMVIILVYIIKYVCRVSITNYLFYSYDFQFISIKQCMEQLNTLKKRVWFIQKRIGSLTVSFNYFIIY